TFKYPRTMDEGWTQAQSWLSLEDQTVHGDQTAAIAKLNADSARLAAQQAKVTPATRQRTQDILTAVGAAGLDPDIRALGDKAANLQREFSTLQLRGYGQ